MIELLEAAKAVANNETSKDDRECVRASDLKRLRAAIADFDSDDFLVGNAEIAEMADVGRSAVSNWIDRYDDFPRPVANLAAGHIYDLRSVQTWIINHLTMRLNAGPPRRLTR